MQAPREKMHVGYQKVVNKIAGVFLEYRKVYCRASQGEWVAHAQKKTPTWVVFNG